MPELFWPCPCVGRCFSLPDLRVSLEPLLNGLRHSRLCSRIRLLRLCLRLLRPINGPPSFIERKLVTLHEWRGFGRTNLTAFNATCDFGWRTVDQVQIDIRNAVHVIPQHFWRLGDVQ